MEPVSKEIMEKFSALSGRLSPENLCCDGELSKTEVKRRLAQINREWKALEKIIGRKMSEDEVLRWEMARFQAKQFYK